MEVLECHPDMPRHLLILMSFMDPQASHLRCKAKVARTSGKEKVVVRHIYGSMGRITPDISCNFFYLRFPRKHHSVLLKLLAGTVTTQISPNGKS